MKKVIIFGAIIIIVLLIFFLWQIFQKPEEERFIIPSSPWIEVLAPGVFELNPDNESLIRELQTGDEIGPGNLIEVKENGSANIYFPDGSLLRLESNTKILIDEASFNPENESLVVKVKLSAGRIWSKILALVNPNSLWEVETTNIVATVRGTAFGSEHREKKSKIIGSENEVVIKVINPETKEVIEEAEVIVSGDKFVEIGPEDIEKIKEKSETLASTLQNIPEEILNQEWIIRNKKEDEKFEKEINNLSQAGFEGKGLREEFRKVIYQKFEETIEARKIESATPKESPGTTLLPTLTETPIAIQTPQVVPEPKELILIAQSDLSRPITEGEKIVFQAMLKMSDGAKLNVTDAAGWRVLGGIGKMEKPGVFFAQLDVSVAELGEAIGTVVAIWQDPKTGTNLVGKSAIITVKAEAETTAGEQE